MILTSRTHFRLLNILKVFTCILSCLIIPAVLLKCIVHAHLILPVVHLIIKHESILVNIVKMEKRVCFKYF